jgi:hypothetical protein
MRNLDNVLRLLRQEHDRLTKQVQGISAALAAFGATYSNGTGTRRKMSAAGRARIVAAQRARWAKIKGTGKGTMQRKRTMSVAARKKIAAAQRARWAKVKGR